MLHIHTLYSLHAGTVYVESAVPIGILCVDSSNVGAGAGDQEGPDDREEHQQGNDTVDDGNSSSFGLGEVDDECSSHHPRTT